MSFYDMTFRKLEYSEQPLSHPALWVLFFYYGFYFYCNIRYVILSDAF